MNITITLKEASDKGIWSEFCDMFGWNYYCLNEGLDDKTKQIMTIEQAEELGLIKKRDD